MADQVDVERAVVIDVPAAAVGDYVFDYRNDPQWRNEVDEIIVPEPLEVGCVVVEHSTFDGEVKLVTPTQLVERTARRAVVRTADAHPYRLSNTRTVEALGDAATRFTYSLVFDLDLVKQVMDPVPPSEALAQWYGQRVDVYLKQVKQILESMRR